MTYAKHKTAQAEFVKAWWDRTDRIVGESLKKRFGVVAEVSIFNGVSYADKLRAIPNNKLRRAGLPAKRRNGKRKGKARTLDLSSIQSIHREIERIIAKEMRNILANQTKKFALVTQWTPERFDALTNSVMFREYEPFARWE